MMKFFDLFDNIYKGPSTVSRFGVSFSTVKKYYPKKYFPAIIFGYIYRMESHYRTLHTIYTITNQDPQPLTYQCRPREIILRQFQDWSVIQQHISLLEDEGLLVTAQKDTLIITITAAGVEKVTSENFNYQD